jgi:hypothetical protein
VIDEDVLGFLRSRPIAMTSTRDAARRPYAHETFLAAVESDHLVGIVLEQFSRNLPENVADNAAAAVLVSRQPGDHRSVQLKGAITSLERISRGPEVMANLVETVLPIFTNFMSPADVEAFLARVASQPAFRFRFEVARIFDQTPGPGAGRPIGAGA